MRASSLLLTGLVFACGAATEPLIPGVVEIPSCQQATLDVNDASDLGCSAAAQLLVCHDTSTGETEACITNDSQCVGLGTGCQSQCNGGNEYAVACQGRSQTPVQPPAGCVAMEGAPNATVYYCCPCAP
jgi:hypothetical protein